MEIILKKGSVIKINGLPFEIYTFGYREDIEGKVVEDSLYCIAKNSTIKFSDEI